ncbi:MULTISPECIES: hypothetical protein [unclassified Kosakonia]|nr:MULTISPECIES: hypothetical protein [unclassified Kosakonia]
MDKKTSMTKMLKLANRLNEIVAEMQARKDALLAEQNRKAA